MSFTKSNGETYKIVDNQQIRQTAINLRLGTNSVPNTLLKSNAIKPVDIHLYLYLAYLSYQDERHYGECCRVSVAQLARDLNLHRETLTKGLRRLEKYNVILIDDKVKPWVVCFRPLLDWSV